MSDNAVNPTTVDPTGLVPRLRGEWATLTIDPEGDVWRLRREAAAALERLRADNLLMAQALQGISPDANTMTPAEAADRVAAVERAIERALS
jgi:hypothetical protein